jgi:hypothetical protein
MGCKGQKRAAAAAPGRWVHLDRVFDHFRCSLEQSLLVGVSVFDEVCAGCFLDAILP